MEENGVRLESVNNALKALVAVLVLAGAVYGAKTGIDYLSAQESARH